MNKYYKNKDGFIAESYKNDDGSFTLIINHPEQNILCCEFYGINLKEIKQILNGIKSRYTNITYKKFKLINNNKQEK